MRVVGRETGCREEGGKRWEEGGTQVVEGGGQREEREEEGEGCASGPQAKEGGEEGALVMLQI